MAATTALSNVSAYQKTAYIDPVNITITSLAINISWNYTGTSIPAGSLRSTRVVAYKFAYDGWSMPNGAPHPNSSSTGTTSYQSYTDGKFVNTDFEQAMLMVGGLVGAIWGPVVYAACGWSTAPAIFNHHEYVQGLYNGNYAWSSSDSVSGGCSNLVHHSEWNNWGSTN